MNMLERKLVDKVTHYHDTAPVFRIEPRALADMEAAAESLAKHVAGHDSVARSHVTRGKERTDIALANGVRARAYHASG